jgi:hypothetical protein
MYLTLSEESYQYNLIIENGKDKGLTNTTISEKKSHKTAFFYDETSKNCK